MDSLPTMALPINLKEGEATSTIYGMIKDHRYSDCIQILSNVSISNFKSRAALSLLAYCHYQMQNFVAASDLYEELTLIAPEVDDYRLYYAQCLYKANLFDEAMKMSCQIDNPNLLASVVKLQAAIKYRTDDLTDCKNLVDKCKPEDTDTIVNNACILFKEEKYEHALLLFYRAQEQDAFDPHCMYNIGLCQYMQKEYGIALKCTCDIIARGVVNYPELEVGAKTDGLDTRFIENSLTLHNSALVEAINLQAAIYYQAKNYIGAKTSLIDLPPRSESELDCITLHNQAIMNMDTNPNEGLEKLQYLLQNHKYPREVFPNLLLSYIKYDHYDLAADVMAEYAEMTYSSLSPYLYEFLACLIVRQTSPEEAYRKLDDLGQKLIDTLRKNGEQVGLMRHSCDEEMVRKICQEYEETLAKYIPILMQQAKIYWDLRNYSQLEKIFHKSHEYCNDVDSWRLNFAHILFMQKNKYKEAIGFYEQIVKRHYMDILNVNAIVLANLCASYIMASHTEEAHELLTKIRNDETKQPEQNMFHSTITNLVLGTLYCVNGNYEFGMLCVIKSLDNPSSIGPETWYYTKRCILALLEVMAKHMTIMTDSILETCCEFLEKCELHGENIKIHDNITDETMHPGMNTVTYEARLLRSLMMELR